MDVNGIASLGRALDPHNIDPAGLERTKLKKAISDFEAIFINQMLKAMRNTINKSGLIDGGNSEKIYTSLIDSEVSKFIASGTGIGLYDVLSKQLIGTEGEGGAPVSAPLTPELRERLEELGSVTFPTSGPVSSGFGMRKDPIWGTMSFHHGIDISASKGAPIYPISDGEVIFSGEKEGYGFVVEVAHSGGYVTRYAHNSENRVKLGDRVSASEAIALVGDTGRSTGPHLHFEVMREGVNIDPIKLFYG